MHICNFAKLSNILLGLKTSLKNNKGNQDLDLLSISLDRCIMEKNSFSEAYRIPDKKCIKIRIINLKNL